MGWGGWPGAHLSVSGCHVGGWVGGWVRTNHDVRGRHVVRALLAAFGPYIANPIHPGQTPNLWRATAHHCPPGHGTLAPHSPCSPAPPSQLLPLHRWLSKTCSGGAGRQPRPLARCPAFAPRGPHRPCLQPRFQLLPPNHCSNPRNRAGRQPVRGPRRAGRRAAASLHALVRRLGARALLLRVILQVRRLPCNDWSARICHVHLVALQLPHEGEKRTPCHAIDVCAVAACRAVDVPCRCDCHEIDAHKGGGEKTSLNHVLHVNVTQSRACGMRLQMLKVRLRVVVIGRGGGGGRGGAPGCWPPPRPALLG